MAARWLLAAGLAGLWPVGAGAQEIVAVLSSEGRHYRQALTGLERAVGRRVPVVLAGVPLPWDRPRVVVLFGGRATLAPLPQGAAVVCALNPGRREDCTSRGGPAIQVPLSAQPGILIAKLKGLQPGLARLTVFWAAAVMRGDVEAMTAAARAAGISVDVRRLEDASELPAALRSAGRSMDAVWLPPDPLLLNTDSFRVLKEFSWLNRIPLYAPTAGLVQAGATAALAPSFADVGEAAGLAALDAAAGRAVGAAVYAPRVRLSVNREAARAVGLELSAQTLAEAEVAP